MFSTTSFHLLSERRRNSILGIGRANPRRARSPSLRHGEANRRDGGSRRRSRGALALALVDDVLAVDRGAAVEIYGRCNDELVALTKEFPDRFTALLTLPVSVRGCLFGGVGALRGSSGGRWRHRACAAEVLHARHGRACGGVRRDRASSAPTRCASCRPPDRAGKCSRGLVAVEQVSDRWWRPRSLELE